MATSLATYMGWYVACGAALLLAYVRSRFFSTGYAIFLVLAFLPLMAVGSAHLVETMALIDREKSDTFQTFASTATAFPMASLLSLLVASAFTLEGYKKRAPVWVKAYLAAFSLLLLAFLLSSPYLGRGMVH